MAWCSGALSHIHFLFLSYLLLFSATKSSLAQAEMGSAAEMLPAAGQMSVVLNETRRRLGSFQICALCTCCGGPKGLCLPSPCCYAINCNIPNRPFGYCSLTPKTCNCFGCHL